ncbi:MAG: lysophospholipid acyltransferase family protein [Arenicellales bacterium]
MSQNKEKSTEKAARQNNFEWAFLYPRYWPLWMALALLRLLVMLPLPVQHSMGRFVGRQFYRRNNKRRRIARINIGLCFPELLAEQKEQLVLRHFESYGASIFDLAMCWWASSRRLYRLTTVHGMENYQNLINQGQKVLLLTGHMLTVDLCGIYITRNKSGVTMMKPLNNPLLNWVIYRSRRRQGNQVVNRDQGLRPLIRYLRRGYTGYFMPDEDFGSPASVFSPFFGVQSWTVTSLSALARLGDAVVLPVFMNSLRGGKGYELYIDPALENFPSGDDVIDATNMNQSLEKGIRRMPEMYSWTFKLFKTRPAGEEAPY